MITVDMTYLKLIRYGTKEMELQLAGGQLVGEIKLIPVQKQKTTLFYSGVLPSALTAFQARESLSILRALLNEPTLRIISLENGQVILEDSTNDANINFDKDELTNRLQFLDTLIKINQEFELNLTFPESLNVETLQTALLLDEIITEGKYEQSGVKVALTFDKTKAINFLDYMKEISASELQPLPPLQINEEYRLIFLKQELQFGATELLLINYSLINSLQELEELITSLASDEEISICLQCDRVIRYFPKWFCDQNDDKT